MDVHVPNGDFSIQIAQEPMWLPDYAVVNLAPMSQQLRFATKEFFNSNLSDKNKEVFVRNQGMVFCTSYMEKDPNRYEGNIKRIKKNR
jgi:hypothetical protein